MSQLSIAKAFEGRHVLITGGTGFVGKVWLAMLLQRLPSVGKLYVLMRGKGRSIDDRFARLISGSPVFHDLYAQHGDALPSFIAERVELVEGDLSAENLGIDPTVAAKLREQVDLVVNVAGLVDFNPDARVAVQSNINGAVRGLQFAQSCKNSRFMHVSTCYVAGRRNGYVPETIADHTPNGAPFDPAEEVAELRQRIDKLEAAYESGDKMEEIRKEVADRMRARGQEPTERRVQGASDRYAKKLLKDAMSEMAADRAAELGWPNTYTYTKALAEGIVAQHAGDTPWAVFRPAIVESSVEFPFAGWNEGFNTSGPLAYLVGTWFRHLPSKTGNPFDVVPVDHVCNALTIACAELLEGQHSLVYQCGTTDKNLLTIDRAVELCALGHRQHLRRHGANPRDRLLRSRWDGVVSDPEHVLNVGNIRRLVGQVSRFMQHGLPQRIPTELREKADDIARTTDNSARKLRQIEELLDLFLPFTHDHYTIFECRNLFKHEITEPEFRFEPEKIDWREYWLDVELPGLRKWCYPTYDDTVDDEKPEPFPFVWPPAPAAKEIGTR